MDGCITRAIRAIVHCFLISMTRQTILMRKEDLQMTGQYNNITKFDEFIAYVYMNANLFGRSGLW